MRVTGDCNCEGCSRHGVPASKRSLKPTSMCSETKETGTANMDLQPCCPRCLHDRKHH